MAIWDIVFGNMASTGTRADVWLRSCGVKLQHQAVQYEVCLKSNETAHITILF